MSDESREHRLKRLAMRSWRRGTKEMDMILGPYSDRELAGLSRTELDQFETLLAENDQDLYLWVTGKVTTPPDFVSILNKVRAFHGI